MPDETGIYYAGSYTVANTASSLPENPLFKQEGTTSPV